MLEAVKMPKLAYWKDSDLEREKKHKKPYGAFQDSYRITPKPTAPGRKVMNINMS